MPTVKAFIRTTSNSKKDVNLRFRYSDGRNIQLFHKSEILIHPAVFDEKRECVKAKVIFDSEKRKQIDRDISDRKDLIKRICVGITNKNILTSEWLESSIDKELHPEKYLVIENNHSQTFFGLFAEFLCKRKLSDNRRKHYEVLKRALQRYELFVSVNEKCNFKLELDSITSETIEDFESFLRNEYTLYDEYKEIYDKFPSINNTKRKTSKPEPRGMNTIHSLFKKLRAFFNWCLKNGKTTNRPFENYESTPEKYGTPYYITIEERNRLHDINLSCRPALEIQRDIFVFQCLIGCRIGDLYRLTKENIINGKVSYIAGKTKDENPETLDVPLNDRAKKILNKYAGYEGKTLFPFISQQHYNYAIKDMFTIAGLTRPVVTLDPLTRENIIRPLNEIASSHLARRCFVGNLYKQVKDPNLVGALSGHKEGSRAFARYREIDDEIKNELVKMLE